MSTTRHTFGVSIAALLLAFLAASRPIGAAPAPTLHPQASPLPFTHQGPFVTTGDGGVLCVDDQNALCSRDEGQTWDSTPI